MSKNKKGEPATKKFVIEAIRKYHATEIRRQYNTLRLVYQL